MWFFSIFLFLYEFLFVYFRYFVIVLGHSEANVWCQLMFCDLVMPAEQQQSVLMARRIWLGVTVSTRAIINEVVESRVLASAVSRFGDAGGFEDLIDLKGLKEPVNFPVIP